MVDAAGYMSTGDRFAGSVPAGSDEASAPANSRIRPRARVRSSCSAFAVDDRGQHAQAAPLSRAYRPG